MRSMTGFGTGSAALVSGTVRVELRALNHRHQEVRVRLPSELVDHAFFLEQLARKELGRGRFDINVRLEGSTSAVPALSMEKAKALYASFAAFRDEVAPGQEVPLAALLRVSALYETSGPSVETVQKALETALSRANLELDKMRATEGLALTTELKGRLGRARELRAAIAESTDDLVRYHRDRLHERIARLLGEDRVTVSPERLAHEVALLADRSDITEELVRLDSHYAQMAELFESEESVGRKLDFLLQEVGREVNTIGSKSQHAPLAHLVVELKAEVERIREQVQNID